MSNSGAGRARVLLLPVLGLAALLVVGVGLRYFERSTSSLPGEDLSRFHPSAVPGHIQALKSSDAPTRRKAAITLWQIGAAAQAATPALIEAARDPDPAVREAAVKALGRTGQHSQEAIATLIQAFQDGPADVRVAAAISLAEAWRMAGKGRSQARHGLGARGGEGPGQDAAFPGKLLPEYEPLARKAVPLLTAALHDPDPRIRTHAAEALAETGPLAASAVPDLIHLIETDPDPDARLQATLALGNVGPEARAAVPILVEKLRTEKTDGVRVNTAGALGLIHSQPELAVPALVQAFLTDPHSDVRRYAMGSIGMFGSQAKLAIPLLQKAAQDTKNQQSAQTRQNINRLRRFIEEQAASEGGEAGSRKGSEPNRQKAKGQPR